MYDFLAVYYDQIHASLTADISPILELTKEGNGPVLELGCGSGRIVLPLAEAGVQVTGIDNSAEMIEIARRKLASIPEAAQQLVTLQEGDMTDLASTAIAGRFDLTLITFNTLFHFRPAEVARIFKGVASLSAPGARLFVDVANPFLIENVNYSSEPEFETLLVDERTGRRLEQWSVSSLNRDSQTLDVSWIFRVPEEDSVPRTVEVAYYYQYPHQYAMLLEQSGFGLAKIMGNYSLEPFEEESERLLLLASLMT